ncbi:MAG: 3-deoxy-manno-octulosonate cytidylyltransferase [Turicibacter sp.]|nr:3-deoxy-manno-octulosonate cytidylyltransferase [Turicibacter sp.]
MKIIAVIPARYNSSRFQGKPLADIHGKPMIWWVYQQVKKVTEFAEIIVATDSDKIKAACEQLSMDFIMTSDNHYTMSARIHEVSTKIDADVYVVVNGDEPLIDPNVIRAVIPTTLDDFYATNAMTAISDPASVMDITNIKVIIGKDMNALYMTRSPAPYPKSLLDFKYYKHLGVIAYSKQALDFYHKTEAGYNEKIEDIDYLRFIENRKPFKMVEVSANSVSVDTIKDLEYIIKQLTPSPENSVI